MPKKTILPPLDLPAGERLQKITYPCGCELVGKAPLPVYCPTHAAVAEAKETLVSVVLDESGSMGSVRDITISAYNEYLAGLSSSEGEYLVTLTKFSSGGNVDTPVVYKNQPVRTALRLNTGLYIPMGGTPLYDAIGKTMQQLDGVVNGRPVIMVVLSDGQENSSREFDSEMIKSMIKARESKGWTFVYLGANQDAWQVGQKFGMSAGSTMNFNTARSVDVMKNMAYNTARYSHSYTLASEKERGSMSSNFFTTGGVTDLEGAPPPITGVFSNLGTQVTAPLSGAITFAVSNYPPSDVTGAMGGKAAADNMTKKERSDRARKAAVARHHKNK